jgi:hypothetical protein
MLAVRKQMAPTALTSAQARGITVVTDERNEAGYPDRLLVYQIRIKGHLSPRWEDWFTGLSITLTDTGETLLTGPVVDQAALYGLLKKVRDLGIPLLSVGPVTPGQAIQGSPSPK